MVELAGENQLALGFQIAFGIGVVVIVVKFFGAGGDFVIIGGGKGWRAVFIIIVIVFIAVGVIVFGDAFASGNAGGFRGNFVAGFAGRFGAGATAEKTGAARAAGGFFIGFSVACGFFFAFRIFVCGFRFICYRFICCRFFLRGFSRGNFRVASRSGGIFLCCRRVAYGRFRLRRVGFIFRCCRGFRLLLYRFICCRFFRRGFRCRGSVGICRGFAVCRRIGVFFRCIFSFGAFFRCGGRFGFSFGTAARFILGALLFALQPAALLFRLVFGDVLALFLNYRVNFRGYLGFYFIGNIVVVGVNFAKCQKAVAVAAVVHERGL